MKTKIEKAVSELNDEIKGITAEIDIISTAIAKNKKSLDMLKLKHVDIDSINKRKRQIAIDDEIGKDTASAVREQLISDEELYQKHSADINQKTQTLSALEERKTELHRDIDNLKNSLNTVVLATIFDETELLGQEYMEHAEKLVSVFRKIQALGAIYNRRKSAHQDPFSSGNEHKYLSIPVFNIKSCNQHPNSSASWPEWEVSSYVKHRLAVYLKDDIADADADIRASVADW